MDPVRDPARPAHIRGMEPIRILTSLEALDALALGSIVCPPRVPSLARGKAWDDSWTTFGRSRDDCTAVVWSMMTMHCPEDAPEVWVLWDSAAAAPTKPAAWVTVIPDRRPVTKAHVSLGHAKSAVSRRMYGPRGADVNLEIRELDPASGTFATLHVFPAGTTRDQLPW